MVPENPVNLTLPGAAWEEDSHNPVGQGGRVTRLTVHVDKQVRRHAASPGTSELPTHSWVSLCEVLRESPRTVGAELLLHPLQVRAPTPLHCLFPVQNLLSGPPPREGGVLRAAGTLAPGGS